MKKVKISEWEFETPVIGEDGKPTTEKKTVKENTLVVLNVLLNLKKPEELPRGLDKFRLFSRLSKAFDKAEKSKVLELDDADHSFLKNIIENEIPSVWGANKNICKAIDDFLEAKEE